MDNIVNESVLDRIYLVDTENIGSVFLDELPKIGENDKVVIFESDKSLRLSFADAIKLNNCIDKIESVHIKNGTQNAMDFMIATVLGHLITLDASPTYIIVSNDKGYDIIINFWKSQGVRVRRHSNINYKDSTLETQKQRRKAMKDIIFDTLTGNIRKEIRNELDEINGDTDDNRLIEEHQQQFIESISLQDNKRLLKEMIKLRADEDCSMIATIISDYKEFNDAVEPLTKQLKYSKGPKLITIGENWNLFFHADKY